MRGASLIIMHESLHGVACASMESSVAASSVRISALVRWMHGVCLVIIIHFTIPDVNEVCVLIRRWHLIYLGGRFAKS